MRKLLSLATAGAVLFGIAGLAGAATLDYNGTLKLSLATLPEVIATDTGVANVTFSSGTHLGTVGIANVFNTGTTIPLTDPANSELVTLIGTNVGIGAGGSVSGITTAPLSDGTLPISGTFKLCVVLQGCGGFLYIPLQTTGGAGVGVGGLATVSGYGPGTRLSIENAAWTVGKATITGIFTTNAMKPGDDRGTFDSHFSGFAHGPGSTSSTGQPGGVLLLVSPSSVVTNLDSPSNFLGLPLKLQLQFVPEPGFVLLLGSGVAGLALLGRYRMRK